MIKTITQCVPNCCLVQSNASSAGVIGTACFELLPNSSLSNLFISASKVTKQHTKVYKDLGGYSFPSLQTSNTNLPILEHPAHSSPTVVSLPSVALLSKYLHGLRKLNESCYTDNYVSTALLTLVLHNLCVLDPLNSHALSTSFQGGQKCINVGHHDGHGPLKDIPRSFARLVITVLTVRAFILSTGTSSQGRVLQYT